MDRLAGVLPTPVVAHNRAVAPGMEFGPQAGLALLQGVIAARMLAFYARLAAAAGDLRFREGQTAAAAVAFDRAADLSQSLAEQKFPRGRAVACKG